MTYRIILACTCALFLAACGTKRVYEKETVIHEPARSDTTIVVPEPARSDTTIVVPEPPKSDTTVIVPR
jgi:hypothetical protein